MRDREWSGDEREVLLSNIARTHATLAWMETAVSTGRVDMDEELARILRGECPCASAPRQRSVMPSSSTSR
jgi:hypothetical protein